MKVKLISHTHNALDLLLFTKDTRLGGGRGIDGVKEMTKATKAEHLAYMKDTIKSSWEFVDYVFEIKEVSRAFTHQLVRTRQGSYAQESMRAVDVSDHGVEGPTDEDRFNDVVDHSFKTYEKLIECGVELQDARNVLPIGTHTSIIAKFNLRTLHEMAQVRLCTRAQGEYQNVFKAMKAEVARVHPWAEQFIKVACAWNGMCIFPQYKHCPIQPLTLKPTKAFMKDLETLIAVSTHQANPVAKDGVTM